MKFSTPRRARHSTTAHSVVPVPRKRSVIPAARLWKRGTGAAAAAVILTTSLVAQTGITTDASWNDTEWVNASSVATSHCAAPQGLFSSQSEGRALSGSLLGTSLDDIAKVSGVHVTNDGELASVTPNTASAANSVVDAYSDPFDASVLSAISTNLTGVLQLPLDAPLGLLGQYAQATNTGETRGASGYLTSAGAINVDGENADYPGIATLKLSDVLNALGYDLGTTVQQVADVALELGAVAGWAALEDPCNATWNNTLAASVDRRYLAAGATVVAEVPSVAAITTSANNVTATLNTEVNSIVGTTGLLASTVEGLTNAVTGVLGLLTGLLGTRVAPQGTTVNLASIDLATAPLISFLSSPITDSGNVLSISLIDGTVRVDTAALLGKIEDNAARSTLNGLAPNTNILAHPDTISTLTSALLQALVQWVDTTDTLLASAVDLATITVNVEIPFEKCDSALSLIVCLSGWKDGGKIQATLTGTLSEFLSGSSSAIVDTTALNLGLVGTLLTGLISGVTGVLIGTLGPLVGAILEPRVNDDLLTLAKLPEEILVTVGDPITAALSSLFTWLADVGIVSVTVNAQNHVATTQDRPIPGDLAALPTKQFDVAAIRIGLLESLAGGVTLYLGRGSVGPVCTKIGFAAGGCTI